MDNLVVAAVVVVEHNYQGMYRIVGVLVESFDSCTDLESLQKNRSKGTSGLKSMKLNPKILYSLVG